MRQEVRILLWLLRILLLIIPGTLVILIRLAYPLDALVRWSSDSEMISLSVYAILSGVCFIASWITGTFVREGKVKRIVASVVLAMAACLISLLTSGLFLTEEATWVTIITAFIAADCLAGYGLRRAPREI